MNNLKKIVFLSLLFSLPATAYDWVEVGVIKEVEPTYMPDLVQFKFDRDAGPCARGAWLKWEGKTNDPNANVQAIYSAALAALMSGKRVKIYGADNCKLEYMHVLAD